MISLSPCNWLRHTGDTNMTILSASFYKTAHIMGFLTASEHCWQRPNLLFASVLSGGLHNACLLGDCLDHFWCKFCCCRCHEMFLQVIIPSFSLFHKCWHPLMFRFGCYKITWAHAMACFQLMVHQLMVLPFFQMCAPVYQDWPVFVFCLLLSANDIEVASKI